jgi:hypothetical protein
MLFAAAGARTAGMLPKILKAYNQLLLYSSYVLKVQPSVTFEFIMDYDSKYFWFAFNN